ncbi:3' terminal RNA ribose 2'-O-methyltransferase Hen1 [Uniformispora flossi]|uniref:3' terminal RNA ribose 2'-O-methyltransferase Hen1 n=1 Tax=Uniformispora flossi TaxID=3390723 RepID=UPI003C2EC033
MFLTIATTRQPAADLGFLLYKHPEKAQQFGTAHGTAHVFYPEAGPDRCEVALLLDVDPIALVRGAKKSTPDFALAQYVNDRPYAASSLLAVALGSVFRTAMQARCGRRPELVDELWPLEVRVPALPSRGGPRLVRGLFEPLGWAVEAEPVALDERFPEWGDSRYVRLRLTGTFRVADALRHLCVLLPVLDDAKHYWVTPEEVEKLLRAGEGWLATHPERGTITRRYLSRRPSLTRTALQRLAEIDDTRPEDFDNAVPEDAVPEDAVLDDTVLDDTDLSDDRAAAPVDAGSETADATAVDAPARTGTDGPSTPSVAHATEKGERARAASTELAAADAVRAEAGEREVSDETAERVGMRDSAERDAQADKESGASDAGVRTHRADPSAPESADGGTARVVDGVGRGRAGADTRHGAGTGRPTRAEAEAETVGLAPSEVRVQAHAEAQAHAGVRAQAGAQAQAHAGVQARAHAAAEAQAHAEVDATAGGSVAAVAHSPAVVGDAGAPAVDAVVTAVSAVFSTTELSTSPAEAVVDTPAKPVTLATHRRDAILGALRGVGAARVLDLGCGDGKLVGELLKERRFTEVVGVDVSARALQIAARKLRLERMGERQRARVRLMQGALTYTDARLAGFDAAVLSEVIEHVDGPRLPALEFVVFGDARPGAVVVTTPNVEYNVRYAPEEEGGHGLPPGAMRHSDHRFEWDRARFRAWAAAVGERYGYDVVFSGVGDADPELGSPTQMAVFTQTDGVPETGAAATEHEPSTAAAVDPYAAEPGRPDEHRQGGTPTATGRQAGTTTATTDRQSTSTTTDHHPTGATLTAEGATA